MQELYSFKAPFAKHQMAQFGEKHVNYQVDICASIFRNCLHNILQALLSYLTFEDLCLDVRMILCEWLFRAEQAYAKQV